MDPTELLISLAVIGMVLVVASAVLADDRRRWDSRQTTRYPLPQPLGPNPTRDEVFVAVRAIIVENVGVEPSEVTMATRFRDDLMCDELDCAELFMDFEDKFLEIGDISEEDEMKIKTVGDAVDFIHAALIRGQTTTESPAEYGASA